MPRETDGTWGRYGGEDSHTVRASDKVQETFLRRTLERRFRHRAAKDAEFGFRAGIPVFDERAAQAEASRYQ